MHDDLRKVRISINSKPITMQKEIIAAIAAYLEQETSHCNGFGRGEWIEFGGSLNPAGVDHAGFCQEIAAEIAAAIAPLVKAGDNEWKDAPEWAEWRIFDEKKNVAYSQSFPSDNTKMQVPKDFGTTQKVERRPK